MLDILYVRENLEAVRANCANRQVKADPAAAVQADDLRRSLAQRTQQVQERQNEVSKLIPKEKDPAARQALIAEGKTLREEAQALEGQLREAEQKVREALCQLPNLTHPDAPVGADPDSNKDIRHWGDVPAFDFVPKDHVALMEGLDLVDFEAGSSVTGPKFYFLKNEAVLLELA
ncbi:MAG: serine--tRNA ligase, partial [Gemmataceae bacterium]